MIAKLSVGTAEKRGRRPFGDPATVPTMAH